MRGSKVVAACIFNELQAVGLFLAFDGASTRTDPFTSGKKYRKSVNNAVFIRNKSLFFVSAAATSAFQLEHTLRLLRSACMPWGRGLSNTDYRIWENISHVGLCIDNRPTEKGLETPQIYPGIDVTTRGLERVTVVW